jgi:DNA-binding transcriptional LysR family regulator
MLDVELRLLRYVVAVADELHFTRAALRVRVAQPSLSKQIHDLEGRLGVQLFDRTHRQVSVTPAGNAFVEEARISLAHAEQAVRAATAFKPPAKNKLTIGYSPRINLRLLTIVRNLAIADNPALRIELVSSHTPEQLQAIAENIIQIGLVTLPSEHEAVSTKLLVREPLTVALHPSHRLSAKIDLKVRELNGVPVISYPRRLHPLFHDHLLRLFKREGYSPNTMQEAATETEALYLVAEDLGAAIIRPSLASVLNAGIVFRRFRESSLVQETAVAYRRQNLSADVETLVLLVRKTVERCSRQSFGLLEIGDGSDPRQLKLFRG